MRLLSFCLHLLISSILPLSAYAIDNCGIAVKGQTPQRIVTLNQHSTELLLQLGVGDRMVGTAYPDDAIWQPLKAAYDRIPRLSVFYPTVEQVLFSNADFIVGGFNSAFSPQGVGDRHWWQKHGINSYLLPSNCSEQVDMDTIWQSIRELGEILNVTANAQKEIKRQQHILSQLSPLQNEAKVLLWSHDENSPYIVGGRGIGQEMIRLAGARNIGDSIPRPWGHITWEAILLAKPDLIIFVEADWAPASSKQSFIQSHPVLSQQLSSIPSITMPFSETIEGIRTAQGVLRINKALADLEDTR
ncbi:ABC transporter substrate-binding protein [Endozoicomonas atrinae]|uniref:ABC transporter substrate-binding protein n=1 Tax=Endozoicomonas atrinae TaxID=1333660 RepID=UPI000826859C|nr:ABC transporter substrate-binding protein [Endozoicomonas atrinae]